MKSTLLIAALLISLQGFSQFIESEKDKKGEKIKLHLYKGQMEQKEGKAFFATGLGIQLASSLFLLSKSKDREHYAGAVGVIGGAFTIYGFVAIVNSHRHVKKAHYYDAAARR